MIKTTDKIASNPANPIIYNGFIFDGLLFVFTLSPESLITFVPQFGQKLLCAGIFSLQLLQFNLNLFSNKRANFNT